ncbi:MAG: hypothetical protein NTV46_01810, partial [Verrucomicrobia bacterium]|nr:hypothetical protein [Verrucomicrobiota bacterium]
MPLILRHLPLFDHDSIFLFRIIDAAASIIGNWQGGAVEVRDAGEDASGSNDHEGWRMRPEQAGNYLGSG